jgi:DNA-directed RNA polymerase specialized sigma24 family protein
LATLSQRDREILALRFGGDLTGREIADVVGLSRVNVQQILSRSLRSLRAVLESGVSAAAGAQASGPTPNTPSAATSRQQTPEVA